MDAPRLTDLLQQLVALANRVAEQEYPSNVFTPKFTKRELAILGAIGTGTLQAKQIAKLLSLELNGSLRDDLAVMTRYGVLTNAPEEGYSVSERYRHAVPEEVEV